MSTPPVQSESTVESVNGSPPRPQKRSWAEMDKPKTIFDACKGIPSETSRLHWLLDSGEFSDLQIKCGLDIFNVHRAVVLVQSTVFHKQIVESNAGILVLDGENISVVQEMIAYFYDYEFHVFSGGAVLAEPAGDEGVNGVPTLLHPHDDPVVRNAALYGMATRYGIPGLRKRQLERMAIGILREVMDYEFLEEILVDTVVRQAVLDDEDRRWGRVLRVVREFRNIVDID